MSEYMTMREIGSRLGMTSHQIGRKLKELALRTPEGKPNRKAFEAGLCEQRWAPDGVHYVWAWHGEKVLQMLGADAPGPGERSPR